jgi:DNA-binding transcriptional LysR family regulator
MDLNRAAVFVRVVDEGGFTAAARALRLPKSSISRAVALLEEELGARLLQRSTRKVRLTEAGTAFYERAARGIAGVQEAADAVADLQGTLRGRIRLTAPADAATWLMAPLIARFVAEHPAVHVELVLTARVVDLVTEGFDFAMRAAALTDSTLVARRLAPVEVRLYAAPSYLARRPAPATVAELAQHDCVLFRPERGRATWTLRGPDGDAQQVSVRGPIGADDFAFLQQAAVAGAGIALLPSFLCRAAGAAPGALVPVLPGFATPAAGNWHLVYPSARYLPRRAAVFRDLILAELGEAPTTRS